MFPSLRGEIFPLASLFLGHIYESLDMLSKSEASSNSHFAIDSFIHVGFLQVFMREDLEIMH